MKEALIEALKSSFPDRSFETGADSSVVAVFRGAHPEVGDLVIWNDGDDAVRISIEHITHGHFADYDASPSEHVKAHIVSSVIEFLQALFEDRVLLWRAFGGSAGGWRVYESREAIPKRGLVRKRFVWSGPVDGAATSA
jgi:hypothetical protein